jgi:hypothetical protein
LKFWLGVCGWRYRRLGYQAIVNTFGSVSLGASGGTTKTTRRILGDNLTNFGIGMISCAMTEPLSQYRLIGDLLHQIDQLLRLNLKPHSLEICRALIQAYSRFCVGVGDVNRLAPRGMMAEKCLAKGPQSRKTRGAVVLEVVCKHADKFWKQRPALRGNKTFTAEEIAPGVNEELKSLGQTSLRPKTIADKISKVISGGLRRTG